MYDRICRYGDSVNMELRMETGMQNEEQFMVGGFLFGSKEDVKLAKAEESSIQFLEQKMNFEDTNTTLRIYEKALKEKIFKTPVGFEFLRKIQTELMKRGVPPENIKSIPLYQIFSQKEEEKTIRIFRPKAKPDKTKEYLRNSLWLNMVLILLTIGMFVISLFGETPNIVNYRFKIQDEYASWEQDLMERENRIKEKERELNLE